MSSREQPCDVVVVLSTAPAESAVGKRSATELAQALLQERLCACVNVVPGVVSHYWWEGRLDEARESLLVCKTTAANATALRERLVALHPYEVPEVLVMSVGDGHPDYLRWIAAEVRPVRGEADG